MVPLALHCHAGWLMVACCQWRRCCCRLAAAFAAAAGPAVPFLVAPPVHVPASAHGHTCQQFVRAQNRSAELTLN